jgi:UDP:flavonoid glycosyltransferase YjiC (YdhE family)/glycosyltransferase involved in cell wall biosynthesis
MAKILIYTSGTLGDHLPHIALGRALTDRGHRVRLAINQAMHPYAHGAGLEAVALMDVERGPEEARANAWAWDHWNHPDPAAHPKARFLGPDALLAQVRELAGLCREADLLLATSIRLLGFLAQAATDIPWLTVSVNPFSFWQPIAEQEQDLVRRDRLREYGALGEMAAFAFDRLGIRKPLPPFGPGWMFARHVLLGSSRHFSRPDLNQLQPRGSLEMTGFWFWENPEWAGWQPDEGLREFGGRSPLALSFSSQPLENPRPLLALHVEAAARLGVPLLVQRGWTGFSEDDLPPETDRRQVRFADFIPHDWLFAHAAASIQHGGIGSIARALRQGCPLLIEPFGNDQMYNASRVADLGVGAVMHPFRMTAEGLARVLREKVLTPSCRAQARSVGVRIGAEDGLGAACRLIETYLGRPREADGDPDRPVAALANPHPPPIHAAGRHPAPATPGAGGGRPATDAIPRILHQTWRDAEPPAALAALRRTWQAHHPGWTFHLWTDPDNRELIRRHYPWFLPWYDGYPESIMRADAARYFILHHYGGVYADLDFECLRPMETLLEGRSLVLGLEPPAHLDRLQARLQGLRRIVGNAWIASAPRHAFWPHVFQRLAAFRDCPGPLHATGPFFLTRACDTFPDPGAIHLLPAELLYPIDNETVWAELPPDERDRLAQAAYGIHHWRGGWWRKKALSPDPPVRATLLLGGTGAASALLAADPARSAWKRLLRPPRISCLMVTGNRTALARRAVRCFQQQTYPHRELVIVDDGADDGLARWIGEAADPRIVYRRLPEGGRPLGALRNLAVAAATGDYLAQWDDDDLSAPDRLEVQLDAAVVLQADACLLERQHRWWPGRRRLAVSCARPWEGSMLCERGKLPPYPDRRKGEDTPVIERLLAEGRIALLDCPRLFTYVFHGANTFEAAHWETHWQAAGEKWEGERYEIALAELGLLYQMDLLAEPLPSSDPGGGGSPGDRPAAAASPAPSPEAAPATPAPRTPVPSAGGGSPERLLILVPVKDGIGFLPGLFANLASLTYPHGRISVAFLESDSADGTPDWLRERLPALQREFARAELFQRNFDLRLAAPRWEPGLQLRRRSVLARSRNYLLARALRDEEWVLWIDADVAAWPPDVIERLLAAGRDIVVPHCLRVGTAETFDLNTFRLAPDAGALDWSPYLLDGILQPPKGFGRTYLSGLREFDCVEVDGVGGTMLLVRADLHREGLVFPSAPYRGYIETEGLAFLARDLGHRCWALPNLEIFHP